MKGKAVQQKGFTERRKEYRLPFEQRVIFADEHRSMAAYALNISRGGLFLRSLDPYPLDTQGHIAFMLPGYESTLCLRAKMVHFVFDRQRCEVECGMGFMFMDIAENHRSLLHTHILNEQAAYMEMKALLESPQPDPQQLDTCLSRLPFLKGQDLLSLRYRVNRICTLFEPVFAAGDSQEHSEQLSA